MGRSSGSWYGAGAHTGRVIVLGVVCALVLAGVVTGVALWQPPTMSVAGTAHSGATGPAPVPDPRPGEEEPVTAPDSPVPAPPPAQPPTNTAPGPPVQRPGTIRLPAGGTAFLIRQDVVNGVLPVPERLDQAAWWGAALDARRGASVFAGHVNWGGRTGPFAELWTARIGQEVTIVDHTGKRSVYRISQLFSIGKDELPQRAPQLFAQTGAHRIVLVTCGGEWAGGAQGYRDNRVAIADPV